MAELTVTKDDLVVQLSTWEKIAAFHREVHVPLAAVQSVAVDEDPWTSLRGMRAPGTGLPGVVAYGVRRGGDRRDFAAVHGRDPAVRVDLDESSPFSRLVVSVPDPGATVSAVRAAGRD